LRWDDIKILFPIEGIEADACDGDTLLDAVRAAGLKIEAVCAGKGTCGKCKVRVDGAEALACRTAAEDGMRVEIMMPAEEQVILTDSIYDSGAEVTQGDGSLETQGDGSFVRHSVPMCRTKEPSSCTSQEDSAARSQSRVAFAVDVGTTTVVVKAVEAGSCDEIGVRAFTNPQRAYGADVLSRINNAMDDATLLSGIITSAIDGAIEDIMKNEAAGYEAEKIVLAGNTTMTYLLLGLRCRSLGLAPFDPEYAIKQLYDYTEVFGRNTLSCPVLVYPYISAFVGGDIVAGLVNIERHLERGNDPSYMLIDMGTNGELAYRKGERLLTTSTAAGPALEGGNIFCGMSGLPGAIYAATYEGEGKFSVRTIGDRPALGICGSGVISLMAALLDAGLVSESGAFTDEADRICEVAQPAGTGAARTVPVKQLVIVGNGGGSEVVSGGPGIGDRDGPGVGYSGGPAVSNGGAEGGNGGDAGGSERIVFTQKDVREFQLAKGAIRAGVDILTEEMGELPEMLYLAGGFGQNIDLKSAFRTGLIPRELEGRIRFAGNTSLGGCLDACFEQGGGAEREAGGGAERDASAVGPCEAGAVEPREAGAERRNESDAGAQREAGAAGPLPSLDIIAAAEEINLGSHKSFNAKFMETMMFE